MRDKYSKSNVNNVSGNIFNGPTNIVAGNNYSKKAQVIIILRKLKKIRLHYIHQNLFGEVR